MCHERSRVHVVRRLPPACTPCAHRDTCTRRTHSAYDARNSVVLQARLHPLMQEIAGVPLVQSYTYVSVYRCVLGAHPAVLC